MIKKEFKQWKGSDDPEELKYIEFMININYKLIYIWVDTRFHEHIYYWQKL